MEIGELRRYTTKTSSAHSWPGAEARSCSEHVISKSWARPWDSIGPSGFEVGGANWCWRAHAAPHPAGQPPRNPPTGHCSPRKSPDAGCFPDGWAAIDRTDPLIWERSEPDKEPGFLGSSPSRRPRFEATSRAQPGAVWVTLGQTPVKPTGPLLTRAGARADWSRRADWLPRRGPKCPLRAPASGRPRRRASSRSKRIRQRSP